MENIFSSNTPLTDTFLKKQTTQGVMKICETLNPYMEGDESEANAEEIITLSAVVKKHDMNVLYAECGQDFVDLLFTFLAVPLESVLEISGNSFPFGCIGNLYGSFKDLSVNEKAKELTSKSVIPHYCRCQKKLLNNIIITEQTPVYYRVGCSKTLTKDCTREPVVLMDPKSHGRDQSPEGSGFVKRGTEFTVSDDLIITPMNSSSTICLLKKFKIQAEDLEVQEISLTKTEVIVSTLLSN